MKKSHELSREFELHKIICGYPHLRSPTNDKTGPVVPLVSNVTGMLMGATM